MQKYYRDNEIFIGLDENSMPMFIPLNIFMSDIITKTIKLKKNSQGVSLQTLFEQVHLANLTSTNRRQRREPPLKPLVATKKDKQKAGALMEAFEKSLKGTRYENP